MRTLLKFQFYDEDSIRVRTLYEWSADCIWESTVFEHFLGEANFTCAPCIFRTNMSGIFIVQRTSMSNISGIKMISNSTATSTDVTTFMDSKTVFTWRKAVQSAINYAIVCVSLSKTYYSLKVLKNSNKVWSEKKCTQDFRYYVSPIYKFLKSFLFPKNIQMEDPKW